MESTQGEVLVTIVPISNIGNVRASRTFVLGAQNIVWFFEKCGGCFSLTLFRKSGKVNKNERDDENQ